MSTALGSLTYTDRGGATKEYPHSFSLAELDQMAAFIKSRPIRTLYEVSQGASATAVRHDVDHSLVYAARFARWEYHQGIRSSYYILPTAFYWTDKAALPRLLYAIASKGHEIGIHNNSMTEAFEAEPDSDTPRLLDLASQKLAAEIEELRSYGVIVNGCAAHGSEVGLDNLGVWDEWDLADFGLSYEAYHLNAGNNYVSDNRGRLVKPLEHVDGQQTRILIHPEHWSLP